MHFKIADINNIKVGDEVKLKKRISEESLAAFKDLTGDDNPLHMDEDFAKSTEFSGRIVHGMLGASYISTVIGTMLPGIGTLWLSQDMKFLLPVRVGDEIEVVVEVTQISAFNRVLLLKTDIFNQNGIKVLEGNAKVKILETTKESNAGSVVSKVALVTGSSRGIGAEIARYLAKSGVSVIINYRQSKEAALSLVEEITSLGWQAAAIQADLALPEDINRLVEEGQQLFGSINILVNNASGRIDFKKFAEVEWSSVEEQLNLQVRAAFLLCNKVLPFMVSQNFGRIVNILTTNIEKTRPMMTDYTIGKAGLLGLSKCLAVEYGPFGITVNMVSPGMTETQLIDGVSQRVKLLQSSNTPMRRLARPNDVAGTVAFLVSPEASHITGVNIPVCGGYTMQG